MNELITIQRTDEYKKTKFGLLGNISDNGCGAIAAYNILNFEGIDMSLKNTIRGLRRCLGLLFGMGKLGTNLFALKAYLMKFFTVRLGIIPLINHRFSDSPSSAVIFYYWRSGKKVGAHYITAHKCEDGLYDIYNYVRRPIHVEPESFIKAMKAKKQYPMWILKVFPKRR